jgi:hypothetical protein
VLVQIELNVDANLAARFNATQLCLKPLIPRESPLPHNLAVSIHTMYLKEVLCQINANTDNLHRGRALS